MNFIKKTVKKAANGIELESLKYERGNLKEDIRKLREKIANYEKKERLKTLLTNANVDILRILSSLSPECNVENALKDEPKDTEDTAHQEQEKPLTYKDCLRISYNSLNSSYDELKNIIEKLEKEVMMGTERYTMDIEKKTSRIATIDEKLSGLREKGVL